MTTKELLHRLVDDLDDGEAAELLRYAEDRYPEGASRQPLPSFVGMFASDQPGISENVDQYLADGFGR
jgi:hypothetical protein